MASHRLDYDDAYTTRFEARVAGVGEHRGRSAVELESTYFYPESGGQEADRGTLGAGRVVDVQSGDDGRIWHVVEADPALGTASTVAAEVDWPRRFDHMQQHTGQHILSAAFERVLEAETISSRLGEQRCTLEVGLDQTDWRSVESVENAANAVVWEDRPIERHWVDEAGLARFSLRKAPAVRDRIRIVQIPDWDVSACGGTHTRRTGEVGIIKVVGWEKVRGRVRFEFLCGQRAARDYGWRLEALVESARRRTLGDRELIGHLEKAASERDQLRKQLGELARRLLAAEARERVGDPPRPVAERMDERSREELRTLTLECVGLGAPWAAWAAAAPEPVLMIGSVRGGDRDLRRLLPDLLERARGKGGGSPDLVQVTASDAESLQAAWEWAVSALRSGEIP